MLHIYKDPITGKHYQVYDDEPPDNEEEEEETEDEEDEEEEENWQDVYQRELDRHSNWLYK